MKIYLVRHGETDWNKNGILMGQADIPLNKNGKNQAKEIARELSQTKFDIYYSSPLSRAKETAEIICGNRAKIIIDDLLKERDCGKYSGMDKHQVDWNEYNGDENVETARELFMRAQKFAGKIKSQNAENILIVSHSGLLKNLYHILQGKTFETFSWDLYDGKFKNNGEFIAIELLPVRQL